MRMKGLENKQVRTRMTIKSSKKLIRILTHSLYRQSCRPLFKELKILHFLACICLNYWVMYISIVMSITSKAHITTILQSIYKNTMLLHSTLYMGAKQTIGKIKIKLNTNITCEM